MANSVIGALRVNLGLDSAQFDKGLKDAGSGAANFAKTAAIGFAAVAAAATAAFATVATAAKRADDAWKASQSLGIPIRDLGRLTHAADMSGASFQTLQTGIRRASQTIGQAMAGMSNESTRAFDRIGVSLKNADGTARDMTGVMGDVAEQFANMPNGAEKTALAVAMFGRSGAELIPMLNAGRQGLSDMGDEAERLGLVFNETTGRLAERFNDNLARMGKATEGLVNAFGAMLLPAAVAITDALVAMQQPASAMVDGFVGIAQYVGVAAAALAGFFAPAMMAGLASLSVAIGTTLVGAVRAVGLAMMANPLGALVAGIAAAIAAIFIFRDNIEEAIGIDVVGVFEDGANAVIGAMVGAVKAIQAAWDVFPDFMAGVGARAWNAFLEGFEGTAISWTNPFTGEVHDLLKLDLTEFKAPEGGAGADAIDAAVSAFSSAQGVNYLETFSAGLRGMSADAEAATTALDDLTASLGGTEVDWGNGGGGGSGGGGSGGLTGALDAMRAALMTEEQSELASYETRLEQLQAFYEQGLIQKSEYDTLLEAAHQQHADRMNAITQRQVDEENRIRSQVLGSAASIFGSLSSLAESFGEENLALSKAFGVAQAIINTAQGITAALTIPGPAGWMQAAAVAASGAAQIATIMSAQKGGGKKPTVGASGSAVRDSTPQRTQQAVTIKMEGDYQPTATVEEMIDKLLDMQRDGYEVILDRG